MPVAKKRKTKTAVYDETFPIRAYELRRSGASGKGTAAGLGISVVVLTQWMKKHPALKHAVEAGREKHLAGTGKNAFKEFCAARIPKHLRKYWALILETDQLDYYTLEHSEALDHLSLLLEGTGDRARQSLYLHAMIHTQFNRTRALTMLGISFTELQRWHETDPEFNESAKFITEAKKDFCDDALMDLVARRNAPAILFVNKCLNRDRGYAEKVEVNHSGNVDVTHFIDVSTLNLPTEARKQLYLAMQEQNVIDVVPESVIPIEAAIPEPAPPVKRPRKKKGETIVITDDPIGDDLPDVVYDDSQRMPGVKNRTFVKRR